MPLPEAGTLQQVDQLEQQKGPGFETENLPSPKGLEPPQSAPIPIPGTGQTQTGAAQSKPGFSQDYISEVLGTKDKVTPGKLPQYSTSDVYNPRYRSILPGEDSEEAFAKAQPWYNKWGNAVLKMGATALGTFYNGIASIPDTIASIHDGKPWQTSSGNDIDTWLKNLEDQFPNYYTHWENEHPFMSAIPFSGGGANFWADKFVKNLGFTIGAIGGAAVQDVVIGAATDGLGEIPLIGQQVGKAALWLNKVFTGTDKVDELLQLGRAAGRTGDQLVSLERLARAAQAVKVANGAKFAMNLYGAAASEAGVEARDGYNTVRQDLITAYQREKGYSPVGKELEDIEKNASASGNVRFGINLALLGVSDAIQFDAFLKPFSASKSGYRGLLQKELEEGAGKVGLKEGSLDTFERVEPQGFRGKLWAGVKPYIPALLSEGIYEEGGQYAAQVGTQNYYERKYLYDKGLSKDQYKADETPWNAKDQIANILHSTMEGMGAEFGTQEGLENIFLGGLTGIFSAGVEHFLDRKQNAEHRQAVLTLLNSQGVTGTLQNVYDNAVAAHRITEDMKQATKDGDIFKYKNFQHEQFVNFIQSGIKAGRFDLRMAQLDLLRDMPDDQFKKAFGLDKTTDNVKTAGEYISALKDKAQSIKRTYDLINDTFTNPFRYNRKATDRESLVENEKHNIYESWKGDLTFVSSIIKDADQRLGSIDRSIKEINPSVTSEQVSSLSDRKGMVGYRNNLVNQVKLLEQLLKGDSVIDRKGDEKKLKSLTNKIKQIDSSLENPEDIKKYQDTFSNLLNYQVNNENDEGKIKVPPEAIVPLIKYGADVNRLNNYKQSANEAFEVLSTEEGFNKYYDDWKKGQAKAAEIQKPGEAAPTPPTPPNPPPTPAETVTVKSTKGKEKTFNKGEDYFVDLGDKDNPNPQKVKVIGQTKDGVTVEREDGTQEQIHPDQFFKEDGLGEDLDDVVDDVTEDTDTPPPPPNPESQGNKMSESKKDLSFGFESTTDPSYHDKTTPFNNFQRRHQNFLFNLGSTDPVIFNQENKPKIRLIPITAKTQAEFGFPASFIQDTGDSPDNGTIRAVYTIDDRNSDKDKKAQKAAIAKLVKAKEGLSDIYQKMFKANQGSFIDFVYEQYNAGEVNKDELYKSLGEDIVDKIVDYKAEGIYYASEDGNKLGKIGQSVDPNEAIFSTFATTDLTYQGAEPRFTNKEGLDEAKVQDWWRNQRKDLLSIQTMNSTPIYQFQVSRGFPNEIAKGAKNNVLDVGLIREQDLDKPVIEVLTLGNVAINGALNSSGEGIDAHKTSVNMGDMGKYVLNYGGSMSYLNNRVFTPGEARNIFELLKVISDRSVKKEDKGVYFKYLNKIIYLFNAGKTGQKQATEHSITIEGINLFLGQNKTPILMNPTSLDENKDKITDFLLKTFHNVNNTELLRIQKNPKANDLEFRELRAEDGKVTPGPVWKNYNHYLLSNKDPEGKTRSNPILTTRISVPVEGEVPFVGKYSVLKNSDFSSEMFKSAEQPAQAATKTGLSIDNTAEIARINKLAYEERIPALQKAGILTGEVFKYGNRPVVVAQVGEFKVPFYRSSMGTSGKEKGRWFPFFGFGKAEKGDEIGWLIKGGIKSLSDSYGSTTLAKYAKVINDTLDWDHSLDLNLQNPFFNPHVTLKTNERGFNKEIFGEEDRGIRNDGGDSIEKAYTLVDKIKEKYEGARPKAQQVKVEQKNKEQGVKPAQPAKEESLYDTVFVPGDKKESQKNKESQIEYVTWDFGGTMGPIKLGFSNVIRDENGNITDLTPVGKLGDDGKITPYRNPDIVKKTILNALRQNEIKQDESNTSEDDDEGLGNPNLSKGSEPQYRTFVPEHSSYKVANLEKETIQFQRMMPWVDIKRLDNMIRTTSGGLAWGALANGMVYIYGQAPVGTLYHEAFEAVWNHFLDGSEQQGLYNEFIKKEGQFKTYNGETKNFADATVQEAKEQMAEDFREYKQERRSPRNFIERIFQKIIDFIKNFLFGDKDLQNRLFQKINQGYYRNYSTSLRNIDEAQFSRVGLEQFSEAFVQDAIQGMTVNFFMDLFKENSDIIDQLEEGGGQAAKDIYGRLKNRLDFFFEDRNTPMADTLANEFGPKYRSLTEGEDKKAMVQQVKTIRENWQKVKDNWDTFVREHQRSMRVFNVEFKIGDDGDIEFADEDSGDEENKSQSEYDRDIMQIDAKQSASTKVKLLFATIADSAWRDATKSAVGAAINNEVVMKRENSLLALPKQAAYAKLFNYVLHNVNNINGIYDIWAKLKELVDDKKPIDANVQRLINRMDFDKGFENKTLSNTKIMLSLESALSKQKPAFFRQFIDFKNNTYFQTSVLNSKIDQVKSGWIADIKGSNAVLGEPNNTFRFSPKVISTASNLQFLRDIGINITDNEYKRLKGKDIGNFNTAVNKIRSLIEKAANDGTAIPVISSKQLDFDSRLNDLAEIYIAKISGDDTQSQHPNLDNEPTSNFVLYNFVATVTSDANNSATKEEFINKLGNEYFNDIFHRDSVILNKVLFNQDGSFNKPVNVGIVEGRESWDQSNKSTSRLTKSERSLYEINNNLNGVYYTLLPADAKSEWAVNTGTYFSAANFFGDDTSRGNELTKFASQMYKYLQTEVELAKDYGNRTNVEALNRKMGDRKVGNSLRFFADLLPKELVDKIHKQVVDGDVALSSVFTEPEMRAIMRQMLLDKSEASLNSLEDAKIISYDSAYEAYKLNGFDRGFLDQYIDRKDNFSKLEVQRILLFREMNYIVNNIEMHKMFFGDPAQYKDELKRIKSFLSGREITHVDYLQTNEGLNQSLDSELNKVGEVRLEPNDPGYHQFKNHFNTLTIRDIEYESAEMGDLRDSLGDKAAPYERGNEADASALMMGTAYREMLYKSGGRFTTAQENQFQWYMASERQQKSELGEYKYTNKELEKADKQRLKDQPEADSTVAFPILKLMHSGVQYVNGVAIASLDKASWAPMFYDWYKSTTNGKLYDQMQKTGIDYVRMESAHKVGIQLNATTSMYDDKGAFNTEGFNKTSAEAVPLKQLGIQVEQSKKDKGQTEGSQARKIVVLDLKSNDVPIDFGKNYSDENSAYQKWNTMSEDERKAASPIYAKIERHDDALSNLTNNRVDNMMRKLGMVVGPDGMTIPEKQRVSTFILSELERRELPRNIAYAIEIDPQTGDFSQPLEANVQYQKIRQILYSIIEKTVMRPKVNGGQKTMLSVAGFEKDNRIVKSNVNGKPVYVSNTLQFYKRNADGTVACEIMLPYHFGSKLKEAGSSRTKEEVIKYLNTTEEGQALLRGIGFRIPTQGLNSIDFFTVKDFLPEQMGDVIVLPSEITVKAGSDFDIDKLNTYLKNYYIDRETGFPKMIRYKGSEEATKEYLGKLLDKGNIISAAERAELDRIITEENESLSGPEGEFLKNIPGIKEMFSDEQITRDYLGNYRDRLIDKLYQQALENEYFDSIEDLLKLPENYNKLVTPNDAGQLKALRTEIKNLKGETAENTLGNYGKLLDSNFMVNERHAYISSKGVVGIAAVAGTFHAAAQNVSGGLVVTNPKIEARFAHNEINGRISLSGLQTADGNNLISNIISQAIDGGVDVAKDKFLAEMGITSDTLSTFLTLVRMGASPRWAALFINQPAIQEFLNLKAIHSSVSQINKAVRPISDRTASNLVANKFPGVDRKKITSSKPSTYTMKEMEEAMITHYRDKGTLSMDQRLRQLQMLDDYRKYVGLGWDLFNYYQGYNWDTARVNDPNEIRLKQMKYEKANNSNNISNVGQLMADTFIGTMKEGVERLDEGLRSLINVQSGAADSILWDIANDLSKQRGLDKVSRPKAMLAAELSMVDYSIQTNTQINGKPLESFLHSVLLGEKPVAKYIRAIQTSNDKRLVNNPFIRNLIANLDKRKDYPSSISLLERDYDTYTSNVWTDAFRELKDDSTVIKINDNPNDDRTVGQIYRNLVLAAILQNGSKRTSNSISHLVPNETYSEFTRDALRNLNLQGFYENNVFYRTNWADNNIVPYAEEEDLDPDNPDPLTKQYGFNYLRGRTIRILKELTGNEKVSTFLQLDSYKYADKKAVKAVTIQRDEITGQVLDRKQRLYVRVDVQSVDGLAPLQIGEEEYPKVIFKEINAWGDGNKVQEYHDTTAQSVLPNNLKVNEVDDDTLIYALYKAGKSTNVDVNALSAIISNREGGDFEPGEDGVPLPDPTDPVTPNTPEPQEAPAAEPEGEFKEIAEGAAKRASKKEKFKVKWEDDTDEVEGYRVTIAGHPNLKAFVYKRDNSDWVLTDEKSSKSIGLGNTMKEAIAAGVENTNKAIKSGRINDVLSQLGVARKMDEPERDLEECNAGKFSVKSKK